MAAVGTAVGRGRWSRLVAAGRPLHAGPVAWAGHNRWSKVRNVKGPRDAARSRLFQRLGAMLRVAAREGGPDPALNAQLANVVEQCRAKNMPKASIEAAVRGAVGGAGGGGPGPPRAPGPEPGLSAGRRGRGRGRGRRGSSTKPGAPAARPCSSRSSPTTRGGARRPCGSSSPATGRRWPRAPGTASSARGWCAWAPATAAAAPSPWRRPWRRRCGPAPTTSARTGTSRRKRSRC